VKVRLRPRDGQAEIEVTDTGVGIAPEFLPFAFDRFRQANGGITRKHGGLGLGLAIVQSLVEMHGGTVEVESAGLDQGSTFRIRLPLPLPDDLSYQAAKAWPQSPHASCVRLQGEFEKSYDRGPDHLWDLDGSEILGLHYAKLYGLL
jgi:DNA topoisomerase VI subunit B